jgi:hypothetical protein
MEMEGIEEGGEDKACWPSRSLHREAKASKCPSGAPFRSFPSSLPSSHRPSPKPCIMSFPWLWKGGREGGREGGPTLAPAKEAGWEQRVVEEEEEEVEVEELERGRSPSHRDLPG